MHSGEQVIKYAQRIKNALQELQELKSHALSKQSQCHSSGYLDRDINSFTKNRRNLKLQSPQGEGADDDDVVVGDSELHDFNKQLLSASIDSSASFEDAVKAELEVTRRSVKELARASLTQDILQRHLDNNNSIEETDDVDSDEPIFSASTRRSIVSGNANLFKSGSSINDGNVDTVTSNVLFPSLDSDSDDVPLMSSVTKLRSSNDKDKDSPKNIKLDANVEPKSQDNMVLPTRKFQQLA